MLERARAAAAADLDHLSYGDKHAIGLQSHYVQGIAFLGRAMGVWPRDRSAGLLFLVPLWHPVLMAEVIGTLASMSDAPLIVQTGIGGGAQQFGAMGASLRTRGSETDRRLDLVQKLLAGEVVTDHALGIDGASISPRPARPVEWWIGSGEAPAAMERAARRGALYLSPSWEPEQVGRLAVQYRRRCEELGTSPRVICRRDVVLDDDRARAEGLMDELAAGGYRGMSRAALLAGDVESVAERIRELAGLGVDDVVARVASVPQPQAIRSIELLGAVRSLLRK